MKHKCLKVETSKMFFVAELDMCALRKIKLNGKGEVMFGDVVGRVSDVE